MTDETQSDFPEAWKPSPGDTITGTLQSVEVIDPGGNGPYPCLTLKTSDGAVRNIHAFHQVLRNALARRRPKIGDELSIAYQGKREGGSYGGYHSYQVAGGQAQEMNWDTWLPESERRVSQEVPIAPSPAPVAVAVPVDDDDDSLPF